jgi:cobalt-zinc-cadmium efflux system protein
VHRHPPSSGRERTVLAWGAAATLAYVVLAAVMGTLAHSLAVLSEAGHNLADFAALFLSWLGIYLQAKPANEIKTFGYHRAGVLAAFVNVLALLVLTALIVIEAVERLRHPVAVATGYMLAVAAIGLAMNAAIAFMLETGRHDVNIRASFLHMVGDAVSTALLILGALLIRYTGQSRIDPLLSFVIAGFILWSCWDVLRETLNILLEGLPRGLDFDDVLRQIKAVQGVEDAHDLHIWSLGSSAHALSCHVRIAEMPTSETANILQRLNEMLALRFHIHHTTVQLENCPCSVSEGCVIPASYPHVHLERH